MVVRFGQVVLGPPGSGKTTYCKAMAAMLTQLGRKVEIINLDPANDELPYSCRLDINELVKVEEVMATQGIGPNGALVYCMELLHSNFAWLTSRIQELGDAYLIFDLPGQAELYTHHDSVRKMLETFEKRDFRLCSVFLVDAHYANDPGKYMSAVLLTLNTMLQVALPTVNVLSKIDSVEKYGNLQFGLDFYTDVLDLDYLVHELDKGPITRKYHKLNQAIADIVSDYSLVSYLPLSVDDRSTLINVMKAVDKANGYVFGGAEERNIQSLLACAVGAESEHERVGVYGQGGEEDIEEEEEREREKEEEVLKLIARQNVARS